MQNLTSNIENVVRQLIEEGFNKGNMEHWGVPDRLGVLAQLGLLSSR